MVKVDNEQTQTDTATSDLQQVAYVTLQIPMKETKDYFKILSERF